MGVQLHQRRVGRKQVMSEINITPFVDVMLVLLIIFMVAAPLMSAGVSVDLPKTKADSITGEDKPLSVSITENGDIYLQDTKLPLQELAPKLVAILGTKSDTRIFVRGDSNTNYGHIMQVVSTINQAGFSRVAFLTQQPVGQ